MNLAPFLKKIRIVLVEPTHPGNIGGAARALKNMGLARLVLVNPKRFPDPQADWRAAGAKDLMDSAVICESVKEAIADCELVIGTSARQRRIPRPTGDPSNLAAQAFDEIISGETSAVAILFGRESSGLTNQELELCHMHLQIPSSPEYSSLNLAMAVQVVCYELYKKFSLQMESLGIQGPDTELWDRPLATSEQIENFIEHLERVLIQSAFIEQTNPRKTINRLRRLLLRARPDQTELQILRGILSKSER